MVEFAFRGRACRRLVVGALASTFVFVALPSVAQAQNLEREVGRWITQDATDAPPQGGVVFTGSSSIRRWEQLSRDFADYDIIQRGFGGSQFSDLIPVTGDIVTPYNPSAIVVFEGTNDVNSGKSADTVIADYQTFVSTVRASDSSVPILYIGITPAPSRAGTWGVASEVNQRIGDIAASDATLTYIDAATPFLVDGQPPAPGSSPLFLPDNLHLTQQGYDVFTDVIRPAVQAAVAPKTYQPNAATLQTGESLFFDLGPSNPQDGNQTDGPDARGNVWNNWHEEEGGLKILAGTRRNDLVTADGRGTGIDLVVTGGFVSNGIQNGGLLDPDETLLGDFATDTVTEDYFFGNGPDSPAGLMLSGLDPEQQYDLELFGTRNSTQTRVTGYVLVGEEENSLTLQTSGNNIGSDGAYDGNDDETVLFEAVQPDEFGQFFLDVQRLQGDFSYLGGLKITAVPEPASMTLLMVGGGLLLRRRR